MPIEYNRNGIKYTTYNTYVDVDTGNVLTKKDATNRYKYIIIKKIKHATEYTNNNSQAIIRYTIECRRNPQGKLW